MSANRSGDHGQDNPDLSGPGLRELFRALTAEPSAAELAGEQAALAAFRAIQAEQAVLAGSGPGAAGRGPERRRRPARLGWRLRAASITLAGAAAAAALGAAYAQALPGPAQRAAYHVLGFAGVPDPGSGRSGPAAPGQGSPDGTGSPAASGHTTPASPAPSQSRPGPGRSGSTSPTPGRPAPSGAPSPSPGTIAIAIATQHAHIPAGTPAVLSVRARAAGRAARGLRLSLQERPAGQAGWADAGAAVTAPNGAAVVRTAALTSNTSFRFTDGAGHVSASLTVTVVPRVKLRLVLAHGKHHFAVDVSAPLASPGDLVIVQASTGRGWQVVQTRRLGQDGGSVLVTVPARFAGAQLRAVLPPTATHGASDSQVITIPLP